MRYNAGPMYSRSVGLVDLTAAFLCSSEAMRGDCDSDLVSVVPATSLEHLFGQSGLLYDDRDPNAQRLRAESGDNGVFSSIRSMRGIECM